MRLWGTYGEIAKDETARNRWTSSPGSHMVVFSLGNLQVGSSFLSIMGNILLTAMTFSSLLVSAPMFVPPFYQSWLDLKPPPTTFHPWIPWGQFGKYRAVRVTSVRGWRWWKSIWVRGWSCCALLQQLLHLFSLLDGQIPFPTHR